MANIQTCKQKLSTALCNLYNDYQSRYEKNPEHKDAHLTLKGTGTLVATGTTIGTVCGTALPGVGNAVGAGAGALAGLFIAGGIEINNRRENKKLHNAEKIDELIKDKDFAEKTHANIFDDIAEKVITDREFEIKFVENTPENINKIANYFAVNIMAAIKHDYQLKQGTNPLEIVTEGLRTPRSRKEHSEALRNSDGSSITLQALAQGGRHRLTHSAPVKPLEDKASAPRAPRAVSAPATIPVPMPHH